MSADKLNTTGYYHAKINEGLTFIEILDEYAKEIILQSEKERELYEALKFADEIIDHEVNKEHWILKRSVIKSALEKYKPKG